MLLILDINGVLCCKVNKSEPPSNLERIELYSYDVLLRPGYREFLDFCFSKYQVAFFTSTIEHNALIILKSMLTPEQMEKVVFKWFRDKTRMDIENGTYATAKILSDVFTDQYTKYNTIICDDSLDKLRFNNSENTLIFPEFKGDINDHVLINMPEEIIKKFAFLETQKDPV